MERDDSKKQPKVEKPDEDKAKQSDHEDEEDQEDDAEIERQIDETM